MSLFTSLQLANNALHAAQTGLHVTGNNIANANTPGYIRQRVELTPAPTQKVGDLAIGLGVEIQAITQQFDRFLEERLRNASADLANGQTQENVYLQLESVIGELGETDLSTALTNFFGSIHDVLNQPESASTRNLAVLRGETLARDIQRLDSSIRKLRTDANNQVRSAADDINRLTGTIATLNVRIAEIEGGGTSKSVAVGLRDQQVAALAELASIIDIKAVEQTNGTITVFSGGEYLVFEATAREVNVVSTYDRGLEAAEIRLAATDAPLHSASGKLAGLIAARDQILGGYLDQVNDFASTFINEFNQQYSKGQGLTGYSSITSEHAASDLEAALDQVGLPFSPVNGSFQLVTTNKQTGASTTTDIFIHLNGEADDTSLQDLAGQLNSINGISASIATNGKLTIAADSSSTTFSFAGDTSGVLAALGINTFFKGSSALDIGVSSVVKSDPGKFAASTGGPGKDANNAIALADFLDRPLASANGSSLAEIYERFTADVAQSASVSRSVAEGFRVFQQTLEGQKLAISGVSLDEEAVKMITYQRTYQAAANFIRTISELLDDLVSL